MTRVSRPASAPRRPRDSCNSLLPTRSIWKPAASPRKEWEIRRRPVPAFLFQQTWDRFGDLATNERLSATAKSLIDQIEGQYTIELRKEERAALRQHLKGMVHSTTLRNAYKQFFDWIGQPELFKPITGKLEYADVFPLIYLKILLEGVETPYSRVKHLLVDEMQDYTPVHYAVLAKLFPCRKTILGDATQSVNPYSASHADQIAEVFKGATKVTLNKSYRSTWDIMQFALRIAPNPDLIAMERHGPAPSVTVCASRAEQIETLGHAVAEFAASDHTSLAILAKTQKQAAKLHASLAKAEIAATFWKKRQAAFPPAFWSAPRIWPRGWNSTASSSPMPAQMCMPRRWTATCSTSPAPAPCTGWT